MYNHLKGRDQMED